MKNKLTLLLWLGFSFSLFAQVDPVDMNDIIGLLDPNQSLQAPRDFLLGGIIVRGESFNGTNNTGNQGTPINAVGVHGPPMIDGETLRYGPVMDPDGSGKPVIQYAVQWIDNTGYQYQPGPHNTTVAPGNDPLFFDGSRVQTDHTNKRISLRDVTWQAFSVRMGDWIFAQDNKLHNQYHAPYDLPTSFSPYLAWYIDHGELKIAIRHSQNTLPTNSNSTSAILYSETLTNSDVEQWQDWIVHMKMSPYPGDNPFVHIWRRKPGGQWQSLVQYNGPVGWDYSGYNKPGANDDNYLISSYYQWHNYNSTDLNYKVRRLWWKWNMHLRDNTNKYTLNDIQTHLDVNIGAPPLSGPTDLIPDDLVLMPATNGSLAANLTSADLNNSQFSYSLVPGIGDSDNNRFQISGDQLLVNGNVTAPREYSIRLRTENGSQIGYEEAFTFHTPQVINKLPVVNVQEGGPGITDPTTSASNVIDGDLVTRWSRDALGAHLTLELQNINAIDHLQMVFHKGTVRTANFEIQTSMDGINFTTIGSLRTSTGQTTGQTYFGVGGALAKFVRIVGQGNSESNWNSFNEIELYGNESAPANYDAFIRCTDQNLVIDGTVESVWDQALRYQVNQFVGPSVSQQDLSAEFRTFYDENHLYILVEVADDIKIRDSGPTVWNDDAVEIYLDADISRGNSYEGDDVHLIFARGDNNYTAYQSSALIPHTGIVFSQQEVTGGYVVEAKIPWSSIGLPNGIENQQIGIEVQLSDDDDGGTRDHKLTWNDPTDMSWTNPSLFGAGQIATCQDANLWVYLEGPMMDIANIGVYFDEMISELSELHQLLPGMANNLQSGQPYNALPWSYSGTEGTGFTDATYQSLKNQYGLPIVDWVLVELRTGLGTSSTVATQAGLLQADGNVLFTNPSAFSQFTGQYYVFVSHRNHLGIISPMPVSVTNGVFRYDFRTQNSYSGFGFGQKEIIPGRWAMYAGDCDQLSDGVYFDINANDKAYLTLENGVFDNYLRSDFNLNGDVNGSEFIIFKLNNGIFSQLER